MVASVVCVTIIGTSTSGWLVKCVKDVLYCGIQDYLGSLYRHVNVEF